MGATHDYSSCNGDGTFAAPVNYPAGLVPGDAEVGDFNGDGKLDLRVAVRRGNRDGTFGPPTTYPVGLDPWWVTASDVLNNGRVDLLVAN
jgi:hypothetical protein